MCDTLGDYGLLCLPNVALGLVMFCCGKGTLGTYWLKESDWIGPPMAEFPTFDWEICAGLVILGLFELKITLLVLSGKLLGLFALKALPFADY